MAKIWEQGERIPLEHVNELERKAEAYERMVADKRKEKPKEEKKEK